MNNLEHIYQFLNFESEDDFYFLQILQRKKENPHLGSNSRVIKNYYISSVDYLLKHYVEIKTLCDAFNARASLRLNKRSFESVSFKNLENIANTMQGKNYKFIKASYDKACGQSHNDKNKKWIVDVDEEDLIWLPQILDAIHPCMPLGDKVLAHIPSKSGVHLITKPFNVAEFRQNFREELRAYSMGEINIDIHKDNPVNLYVPCGGKNN